MQPRLDVQSSNRRSAGDWRPVSCRLGGDRINLFTLVGVFLSFSLAHGQAADGQELPPYANSDLSGVQQSLHSATAEPTWVNTRPPTKMVQASHLNMATTPQPAAGQMHALKGQASSPSAMPASLEVKRSRTPLPPPSNDQKEAESGNMTLGTLLSVFSSLSIVVGLFLGLAWVLRRTGAGGNQSLPNEVLQVLGRTNVGPKHQILLVQFGPKLVLASLHQGEMRVLSEVSEPAQVQSMLSECGAVKQEIVGYSDTSQTASGLEQIKQFATGLLAGPGSRSNKESRPSKPGFFEQGA